MASNIKKKRTPFGDFTQWPPAFKKKGRHRVISPSGVHVFNPENQATRLRSMENTGFEFDREQMGERRRRTTAQLATSLPVEEGKSGGQEVKYKEYKFIFWYAE